MNISNISFKARPNNNDRSLSIPNWDNRRSRSSLERTPKYDSLERSSSARTRRSHSNKNKHAGVKGFAAGVAAAAFLNGMIAFSSNVPQLVTINYDSSIPLTEIAEMYDVDYDTILDYNNITENTNLNELTEIKVPSRYDYIDSKIEELQNKLYSSHLSDEKRSELQEQIQLLQAKQAYQQGIANVYTDGDYVYIQIKDFDENTPQEIQDRFSSNGHFYGINVEVLKEIFDIKDGYIRRNNPSLIKAQWVDTEPDPNGHRGIYDYSGNRLKAGDTIKIPPRAIDNKNINFNY